MKATINNKEFNLPTDWDQVTWGQFRQLAKSGNDIASILSVFTGIDVETLRQAKIVNLEHLILILSFINNHPTVDTLPDKILGHQIPKDLGMETIAQFEDLKKAILEAGNNQFDFYGLYVATYCVKPYDWQQAEKIAPEFDNAPCLEVLATGNFILLRLAVLLTDRKTTSLNFRTPLRRLKQALRKLTRLLGSLLRYAIWRLKHPIREVNS